MAETLADMKSRIATELRRDDLTAETADAITTAINAYKYQRFPFNRTTFVDVPATDGTTGNAWMQYAYGERLIRARAKLELYIHVIKLPAITVNKALADPPIVTQLQSEIQDALATLRLSQGVSAITATAGTLGYMKVRIANEINRGDLSNEITDAITDAIAYYSNERFFFNETREDTLSTVASQDSYSSSDAAWIGLINKIDYVECLAGGLLYRLNPLYPQQIEEFIVNGGIVTGIPAYYCFYEQKLRLYPIPDGVYTVRPGYAKSMAAPASDVEASNVWMTTAERLVRARAKAELYAHVEGLADPNLAQKYLGLAEDYFSDLQMQTTRKTQVGAALVKPYDF
jgi:hypothetical protein